MWVVVVMWALGRGGTVGVVAGVDVGLRLLRWLSGCGGARLALVGALLSLRHLLAAGPWLRARRLLRCGSVGLVRLFAPSLRLL